MAYQQQQDYYQGGPAYQQPYQQQPHQQQGAAYPSNQMTLPSHTSGAHHPTDSGSFPGGTYSITHRDTNTVLTITMAQGGTIKSCPGAMIEMSPSITLQGKTKFSFKKIISGGELHESVYTGTGLIVLGPTLFGDIATLQLDGTTSWNLGKHAFLACTADVQKEAKTQGFTKALFSGEDLFVYRIMGHGLLWLYSFGAITRRELGAGEQHIVDNGHLVAWNCDYKIERAGSGAFSSLKSGEGLVCRFTGPGTIYIQTRNLDEFEKFISETAGSSNA